LKNQEEKRSIEIEKEVCIKEMYRESSKKSIERKKKIINQQKCTRKEVIDL
jgi:hypothetical protein